MKRRLTMHAYHRLYSVVVGCWANTLSRHCYELYARSVYTYGVCELESEMRFCQLCSVLIQFSMYKICFR